MVCLEEFGEALGYRALLGSYLDPPAEGNVPPPQTRGLLSAPDHPHASGFLLPRSAYCSGTPSKALPVLSQAWLRLAPRGSCGFFEPHQI